MSSPITSPSGALGERVEAMNAGARTEETPPQRDHHGPQVRLVPQGRWVEYADPARGPLPALLVAWHRSGSSEPWWARVVVIDEPGVAVELLVAGQLVRPAPGF